jgi:DNA-binding transcriptional LysR family regulator
MERHYFQMNDNSELLDGMTVFTTVVEAGGFSAAARRLRRSVSWVSKEVTRLEKRLKVRLLNRTTRTVVPTDTGQVYYERCRLIVTAAREAEQDLAASHQKPQGNLRVSMPIGFVRSYLDKALPVFMETYPDIILSAETSDRFVDLVAEGFDVVIRAGVLKESSLIAKKLTSSRMITLASPDYLKRHGCPRKPEELKTHACISWANQRIARWNFLDSGGTPFVVEIEPRAICNSSELELPIAINGIGIVQLPHVICCQEVERGELVPILTDYEMPEVGVYAVYPHRAHLSAKVRVFVDFLVDVIRQGDNRSRNDRSPGLTKPARQRTKARIQD